MLDFTRAAHDDRALDTHRAITTALLITYPDTLFGVRLRGPHTLAIEWVSGPTHTEVGDLLVRETALTRRELDQQVVLDKWPTLLAFAQAADALAAAHTNADDILAIARAACANSSSDRDDQRLLTLCAEVGVNPAHWTGENSMWGRDRPARGVIYALLEHHTPTGARRH